MNALTILADTISDSIIGTQPTNPDGFIAPATVGARIAGFFNILFIFGAILATFFVIRGGIDYIMSAGEAGKIKQAQGAIQYAIIGLIVCGVGYLVVTLVAGLLGYTPEQLQLNL